MAARGRMSRMPAACGPWSARRRRLGSHTGYVVSYELKRPGQTYETFWEALRLLDARPVLLSQRVVSAGGATAASI